MSETIKPEQVNLLDCIRLSLLINEGRLSSRHLLRLAELTGSFSQLFELSNKDILEAAGGPPERVQRLSAALRSGILHERAYRIEESCRQLNIKAVACSDTCYPGNLRQINGLPLVLFWRGCRLDKLLADKTIATIVGTRRPTGYGRLVGRRYAEQLAEAGIMIVSGLARGIDTIAHESALDSRKQTLAVLACGLDNVYPPDNKALLERICDQGAVVSEHLPGTPPIRTYFPARNRILSGLADAVIVIEASLKSGSMITASFAADQGRDVYAVPGNVLSRESEGCNRLIAEGAFMLTDIEDVLWRLPAARRLDSFTAYLGDREAGEEYEDICSTASESTTSDTSPASANESEITIAQEICQLLRGSSLTLYEMSDLLNVPLQTVLCNLSDLEIQGRLKQDRGRYLLIK